MMTFYDVPSGRQLQAIFHTLLTKPDMPQLKVLTYPYYLELWLVLYKHLVSFSDCGEAHCNKIKHTL